MAESSTGDEPDPSEESQVETEWHLWLLASLLVGGTLVVILRPGMWMPVVVGVVGIAVFGWAAKEVTERRV